MSKRAVHRKLRDAFSAVIESNKARAIAASRAKREADVKDTRIISARLSVHGTGSITSFPALSLQVIRSNRNELFCFNLNPYMDRHDVKRSSVLSGVFFTRLNWENQGVGCLTLVNCSLLKSPSFPDAVPFHGPCGLKRYIKSTGHCMLSPIAAERLFSRSNIVEDGSSYSQNGVVVEKIHTDGSPYNRDSVTLSYVCRIEDFQPCVDREKMENVISSCKLDVNKSDEDSCIIQKLERGEDVIVPYTGQRVSAEDVLKEPYKTCFVVLDCPTEGHFSQLENNTTLKKFQTGLNANPPKLIIHITPHDLFSSPSYQHWVDRFGDCMHLVMNKQNSMQYTQNEIHYISTCNQICKDFFPPVFKEFLPGNIQTTSNVVRADIGLTYAVSKHGSESWDYRSTVRPDALTDVESMISKALSENSDVISLVQGKLEETNGFDTPGYFPRLVVLGSGGTHNHKFRAHPGFLLMLNEHTSVLLDCGELALERIYKIFGDEAGKILRSIKLIFLSHLHLDHHCGFKTLLEGISSVRRCRPESMSSESTICLMSQRMCATYEPFVEHLREHVVLHPIGNRQTSTLNIGKNFLLDQSVGLKRVIPFPVSHSILTYGITLDTMCGKRIVYSSDTLPMSKQLIRCGRNADLLIHDCLYVSDSDEVEASYRKHSTLAGALETAQAANARFLLLTHFSPRLPVQAVEDIPCDNAAMAYDFLNISLKDLGQLRKLRPAISSVFGKRGSKEQRQRDRLSKRIEIIKDLARMM